MARTIPDFTRAPALTNTSVRFDMPDGSVIYALWDNASLPDTVLGTIEVTTHDGITTRVERTDLNSARPVFVSPAPSSGSDGVGSPASP